MTQGILPFKYEKEKQQGTMTAFGGLPVYLDLAQVLGLSNSTEQYIRIHKDGQGWTDSQILMSLILLNISGGDYIEDLNRLEFDEGFCRILDRTQMQDMRRPERRALARRWRKERRRSVPSPSSIFKYLSGFHDPEQKKLREAGKAFISAANEHLSGFGKGSHVF